MSKKNKSGRGSHQHSKEHTPNPKPIDKIDQERRDALVKIGRFGAYTAPGLLVLLTSERAVAQSPN